MAVEHLRDVRAYAWREGDPQGGHHPDWCPACQYERGRAERDALKAERDAALQRAEEAEALVPDLEQAGMRYRDWWLSESHDAARLRAGLEALVSHPDGEPSERNVLEHRDVFVFCGGTRKWRDENEHAPNCPWLAADALLSAPAADAPARHLTGDLGRDMALLAGYEAGKADAREPAALPGEALLTDEELQASGMDNAFYGSYRDVANAAARKAWEAARKGEAS